MASNGAPNVNRQNQARLLAVGGLQFTPQGTNPIPSGQTGEWVDLSNVRWSVASDGSQTPVGVGSRPIAPAVRVAATSALPAYTYAAAAQTITATAAGAWTIDGVAIALGDRILKALNASDDGIYAVTTLGTASVKAVLTRASDMSTSGDLIPGMIVPTSPEGTSNKDKLFQLQTAAPITLDTTSLTFGRPLAAGIGLVDSGSLYGGSTDLETAAAIVMKKVNGALNDGFSIPINALSAVVTGTVVARFKAQQSGQIGAMALQAGSTPPTTGAKGFTLTAAISGTSISGGTVVATTSALLTYGNTVYGSTVSGLNSFVAGQEITVVASAVTAAIEGQAILYMFMQSA